MKFWRKITAIVILLPFLFSVTGVLIFRTQCKCTGRQNVSLYLFPETCESLLASHQHLFKSHAGDMNQSCNAVPDRTQGDHSDGCGCESPEIQFFKLKNHFTDEKSTSSKVKLVPISLVLLFSSMLTETSEETGTEACKYPLSPPLFIPCDGIIYFLCQPKIPDLI